MDLAAFFQKYPKVAIAFSGGVDSAYLLYAAIAHGAEVRAYYVKSAFQPQFELEDAKKLANFLQADMRILEVDVLSAAPITQNPANRCYHCKKKLFQILCDTAKKDGFSILLDGTNTSDDSDDRPGMKALAELHVLSPLRICGLTKDTIRQLSKEAGLFTWNKPAYACLATRIPTGTPITLSMLEKTEHAESYLTKLGFSDFRVRLLGEGARLQVPEHQLGRILSYKREILAELKKYYSFVMLDLETRD